jgi:hypothetical protein
MEKILAGYAAEMGAVGIFVLVVIKFYLDYLKIRGVRQPNPSCPFKGEKREEWRELVDNVKEKSRADSLLAQALVKLSESTEANTKAMNAITMSVTLMAKDISEIRTDLKDS